MLLRFFKFTPIWSHCWYSRASYYIMCSHSCLLNIALFVLHVCTTKMICIYFHHHVFLHRRLHHQWLLSSMGRPRWLVLNELPFRRLSSMINNILPCIFERTNQRRVVNLFCTWAQAKRGPEPWGRRHYHRHRHCHRRNHGHRIRGWQKLLPSWNLVMFYSFA